MTLVDRYVADLQAALERGQTLGDAMRDLAVEHVAHLKELGPVRVLALNPCPRCGGTVIASESDARCAAGCGWSYRRLAS